MPIWLDGERFETARVPFDLGDRGLLLGDGVFDTALVANGRAVFRDQHLARLEAACAALAIPFDRAAAERVMDAAAAEAGAGSLRLTVTRGAGPRGLAPPPSPRPSMIATFAAGAPLVAFAPIRLRQTAIRRNETSPLSRLKTLNYLDAVLAAGEARREGFDEALFLNSRGRVACAGTGNLFALTAGRLTTPPLADGVLPGILRAVLLDLAPRLGLAVAEASLAPAELFGAEAVFMTNSLRLLAPVAAIDAREFPSSRVHPDLRRLAEALADAVAEDCGTVLLTPDAIAARFAT
ncbi:4-amino-4-deoxychorismate lyase [Aureimonas endophytica]|uniref:Probable branched-chain-amino-acid aminotransferase n=1 Tax=Aureimonas endophytica TaxID=2027858 RepID=A0A916ZBV3_9HYPH|nr:aminotransferase class IV [Aureimonas endophytica]GGD87013.1 4-amino-4-deoxychorismate lyase [Aureimonas endophytica]